MKKSYYLLIISFILLSSLTAFPQKEITEKEDASLIVALDIKAVEAMKRGQLDSVPGYLIEARKLAKKIKNPKHEALTATTLALFYYTLENYDFAAKECIYAIDLIETQPPTLELGHAYHLYALISLKKEQFETANIYFDTTESVFKSVGATSEVYKIALNRGILAHTTKNYDAALTYFRESLEGFKTIDMLYYEALAEMHIAKTLLEIIKSNPSEKGHAMQKIKTAVDNASSISNQNNFIDINILTYKIYSDIALLEEQYHLAFDRYAVYSDKRDSINQIKTTILNKYLSLENREAELNEVITTQQNYLNQKKRSTFMNRITTGLSIILIVILSLLTLALYKNNNLRARTYSLLQDKNSELTIAKERAEKASQAKAQFLSAVTHELRTPMYAITGLTQLLLGENPREDQKEHLNSLKFSGEYLLSLINNILDLNKLEANKVEVEKTPFSLKKRVEELIATFKKQVDDKKNSITLEYDDTIPSFVVGDPTKISQILINLIGNAVKFTENGTINIRISNIESLDSNILIRFEVEDDGIGIAPKKQRTVFDNFTQGSLEINRKYGGTGLGLSIVKNLLLLLNSNIHLESELGKGSKLWFELDLGIPKEKKAAKETAKAAGWNIEISQNENIHVLVVEDNKINQMITKKILEKKKMICTIAVNGKEAIELVKENSYDLILMDVHMPEMSGIEATQHIREFNKDIPIIALTAITVDNNLDDFYAVGFNEVIPKPFKTDIFFEKIYATL